MAADRAAGGRRAKYLYDRVNFFFISKIYNPYVYSTRSTPIVDLSNGLDMNEGLIGNTRLGKIMAVSADRVLF
jgi:hypothetical protein